MMVGRIFLVLTGACQFGHGAGGFTANFIQVEYDTVEFAFCQLKQLVAEIVASLRGDVPDADIADTTPEVPPVGSVSYWCRYAHEILM